MRNASACRPARLQHVVQGIVLAMYLFAQTANAATRPQMTFASPEQAGAALAAAWHSGNKSELLKIYGDAGAPLVSSGDDDADREVRQRLAADYDAQHKIELQDVDHAHLVIGLREFPFPIPLQQQDHAWHFDTGAGAEEILNRRIGRNELNAIRVCRAYVDAQHEYAALDVSGNGLHEYAKKISSSKKRHDGLYWPPLPGTPASPLGPLLAAASKSGRTALLGTASPYHGYYFRVLTRQGSHAPGGARDYLVKGHMTDGFALLAYPARYGDSGIMSFIINQHGIVFEKNLGPDSDRLATRIRDYDPDHGWIPSN